MHPNIGSAYSTCPRFWSKVLPAGPCWVWTRRKRNGYGQFSFDGKWQQAHRVAWLLEVGPIPEGMCVLHRCDRTDCVRPAHLFLGTQLDNIADRHAKDRDWHPIGETNGRAKLTPHDIEMIRAMHSVCPSISRKRLAALYGVTSASISAIILGRTWQHCDYRAQGHCPGGPSEP